MTDLVRKLQLKDAPIRIVDRPDGVAPGLDARHDDSGAADALLAFVRDRAALDAVAASVVENAAADHLTWVAYPKGGQLGTDLNRDRVAEALLARGVRPVRNVSIDGVWSALRFRPGE